MDKEIACRVQQFDEFDVMRMPKLPPSRQHVGKTCQMSKHVKTCQHMSTIANAAACCYSSVTSPPGCTPRFCVAMLQCDLTVGRFTVIQLQLNTPETCNRSYARQFLVLWNDQCHKEIRVIRRRDLQNGAIMLRTNCTSHGVMGG